MDGVSEGTGAPGADERARREELLASLIAAENALDIDALVAVFPHPHYELIGTHRVYDGAEQVERHLRERRQAFPDYRAEVIAIHHTSDAVIAEAWFMGTHLGRIEDLEPTGRAFRCRMAAFYLFHGETLTAQRIYFDQATIARQLA